MRSSLLLTAWIAAHAAQLTPSAALGSFFVIAYALFLFMDIREHTARIEKRKLENLLMTSELEGKVNFDEK